MIKFLNSTKTSYLVDDVLYSYKTPVARVDGATLLVDDVYYSNTTSKQITQCANKLGLTKKRVKNLFDNMGEYIVMKRMHNKHILENELYKVFLFIKTKKLLNSYTIIETENHTIILVLYCNDKDWGELCNTL